MTSPKSNPQTPPTYSRVTLQSTPNSAVNSLRSLNEAQNSLKLELSKEEVFENNLTKLFTKRFLAVLTSKDAVLKEVRDCALQNNPQQKYLTVEVFEKANGPNVIKFLDEYIHIHGVPRKIRLDQARCLIGYKVKNFCKQHNINIITAPANNHRAIGLVERLIQTIKDV